MTVSSGNKHFAPYRRGFDKPNGSRTSSLCGAGNSVADRDGRVPTSHSSPQVLADHIELHQAYWFSHKLFAKLQALRSSLNEAKLRKESEEYNTDADIPF